ncbi:MAG: polysaccharide biosynthesis/export family protein [Deltaproteobacteria bacterium]|nr:polysaccharide biosynthesis/export family protein [Deltaproteobacteria bacterium]
MFARRSDRYFALAGSLLALVVLAGTALLACQSGPRTRRQLPVPEEDSSVGPGDTFEVQVFGLPELSGIHQVARNGTIDFPLIGRLEVAGLEPPAISDIIVERLRSGDFVLQPSVRIVVKEYASKRISVMGQVARPGQFPMQMGLSLVEAISLAGGFTSIADDSNVTIVRRERGGRLRRIRIDVDSGEGDDFYLQAGDSVRVPQTIF